MAVTSVIVETEEGGSGAVLSSLALLENVSVFGVKDDQIVTVIEGDDMGVVEETLKRFYTIEKVIGVFPVFAGDYDT